ncbi:PEP-CTERM sorting domain-containing protein [Edaphobacter bradus]|uniref:PEP-CTERM sorting domain-containing protein n=1 Tax=Edaphobacter bradus TaxID=2259016 RepID=UPI0021DF63B2|nr:PEP-CTERM sorting domain-containing protein [Edaphobacter bradus]
MAYVLVLFLVSITAAKGVHASTDCEKWLTDYKNSLKHSPTVKRAAAAHRRMHRYAHRKIAALKKPTTTPAKPKVLPARHLRPRMSRSEMLKKFTLSCGDLPLDEPDGGDLEPVAMPDFIFAQDTAEPIDLAQGNDGGLLQSYPPPVFPGGVSPSYPGFPSAPPIGGSGFPPGGKTPPNVPPGGGGDQPPPGGGGGTPTPTPEPSTVVFLLTGLSGVVKVARRRRAS